MDAADKPVETGAILSRHEDGGDACIAATVTLSEDEWDFVTDWIND